MNPSGITKKQFTLYLIIAFGLAWILQIISSVFANNGNTEVFGLLNTIMMYAPFLGVMIARIPIKGLGWIPHLKGKIRYLFFALWAPALLSIMGSALFFAFFPDAFDAKISTVRTILENAGMLEQLEAQGSTVPMYFMQKFILAVTIAPFINMLATLGEEVGWRGALYPYLKEKLGVVKGRILGGAIYGCWHWPLIILAGYEYGKEYIGAPVLGPIVFCIFTIVMGIVLDHVYEKTETIWIPTLMHAAINALAMFAFLVKPEYASIAILGPSFIGIIGMIPLLILAVVICVKHKRRDDKQYTEKQSIDTKAI